MADHGAPPPAPARWMSGFPGAVLALSADGTVLASNGHLEARLGTSLTGRPLAEALDAPSRVRYQRFLERGDAEDGAPWELVFDTGGHVDLLTFHPVAPRPDGAELPRLWLVEHPRDDQAEPLNAELTALNSELVNAQRALGKERTRLARAVAAAEEARARAEAATRRLEALQEVLAAGLRHLDTEALLQDVVGQTMAAFSADGAVLFMRSDDGQALVEGAAAGVIASPGAAPMEIPVGHPVVGRLLEQGEPQLIDDADVARIVPDAPRLSPLRSLMVAPLLPPPGRGGDAMGVLMVGACSAEGSSEGDLDLLRAMTEPIALAVDRARLFFDERAARERADRALALRDEVLGIVSHDLRNPLSAIFMSARALSRRLSDEHARKPIALIRREADRMNRLIADLLEVSRLETKHLFLEPALHPIGPLLTELCERYAAQGAEGVARLECDPDRVETTIYADRERVMQVLDNLVGNARKFTPPEGVIALEIEADEDLVTFSVHDTGPGIPEADLPHLFDRFWQARKTQRGGAGLGLAIAKGIVEAHGGAISVASVEGRGSCFRFTLPRTAAAYDAGAGGRAGSDPQVQR